MPISEICDRTEHGQVLRQRVHELALQRESREQQLRLLQGLEEFCTSIRDALQNPSFAVKQKVLQLVVDHILVEDQRVTIRHVVPTQPVRLQPRQHPPEKVYFAGLLSKQPRKLFRKRRVFQ